MKNVLIVPNATKDADLSVTYKVAKKLISLDFNVFLWYIINKGNNINDENLKNIWDNRIRHRKKIIKNDKTKGASMR